MRNIKRTIDEKIHILNQAPRDKKDNELWNCWNFWAFVLVPFASQFLPVFINSFFLHFVVFMVRCDKLLFWCVWNSVRVRFLLVVWRSATNVKMLCMDYIIYYIPAWLVYSWRQQENNPKKESVFLCRKKLLAKWRHIVDVLFLFVANAQRLLRSSSWNTLTNIAHDVWSIFSNETESLSFLPSTLKLFTHK